MGNPVALLASAELRLLNLTPLAAFAGLDVHGSAVLNALLDGLPAMPHLKLDATAALEAGKQFWAAAVGDRARLQLSATLKDQVLAVDSLKFSGHAVAASANGAVGRRSIKGRWDIDVSELGAISPILAGALKASGSIDGPITALSADALMSATVSVRGSPSGIVSAEAKLSGWPSNPSGSVAAQGLFNESPLQVQVALAAGPEGSLRAKINHASWKSVQFDGDLTIAADQRVRALCHLVLTLPEFQLN